MPGPVSGFTTHIDLPDKGSIAHLQQERIGRQGRACPFTACAQGSFRPCRRLPADMRRPSAVSDRRSAGMPGSCPSPLGDGDSWVSHMPVITRIHRKAFDVGRVRVDPTRRHHGVNRAGKRSRVHHSSFEFDRDLLHGVGLPDPAPFEHQLLAIALSARRRVTPPRDGRVATVHLCWKMTQ